MNQKPSGPREGYDVGANVSALRMLHRRSQGMVAVYERQTASGAQALVFEWGPCRTQVATFPHDWHRLEDSELMAIGRQLSGYRPASPADDDARPAPRRPSRMTRFASTIAGITARLAPTGTG